MTCWNSPERAWRYGDGFYLTFAEPTPTFTSNRFISFGLALEDERPRVVVVNRDGEYFPEVDTSAIRFAAVIDGKRQGIVYEAAIPWPLLAPLQPLVDTVWGLNLIYVDRDRGERKMVLLQPDWNFDTEQTDQRVTRPIRFADMNPDHVVVQFRPARTHACCGQPLRIGVGMAGGAWPRAARLDWRIATEAGSTNAGDANAGSTNTTSANAGRELDHGSAALAANPGVRATRGEIPIRCEWPSGAVQVEVELRDGDKELARATLPVLILNEGELEKQRATLEQTGAASDQPEAVRLSIPTALFYLQSVRDFVARATASQDTADVRANLRELALALADLKAGQPVFAQRRGVFRQAHRSAIDGTLQPYSVVLPEGYDPNRRWPLLVALHGSGVDERDLIGTAAELVSKAGWIVLAPRARGLSDWYQGDSGRDVWECLRDVSRRYAVDSRCVVLFGFSMGGFGAWRLSLEHPELVAGAVVLSGATQHGDEDLAPRVEKVAGPRFFVVHGTADNAIPVTEARRAAEILRRRAYANFTYQELEGAGHGGYLKRMKPRVVEWLEQCRRQTQAASQPQ